MPRCNAWMPFAALAPCRQPRQRLGPSGSAFAEGAGLVLTRAGIALSASKSSALLLARRERLAQLLLSFSSFSVLPITWRICSSLDGKPRRPQQMRLWDSFGSLAKRAPRKHAWSTDTKTFKTSGFLRRSASIQPLFPRGCSVG
jgi:hypothetical protein